MAGSMIRPSRIINSISGEPYLRRWHLIPRNRWLNIYLHHFVKSDDDRALHDHPWTSISFLLKGQLSEVYKCECEVCTFEPGSEYRTIPWLRPIYRPASWAHRLIVPEGGSAWTLFITGPVRRQWGFWCPQGWVPWRKYHDDGGCGEVD